MSDLITQVDGIKQFLRLNTYGVHYVECDAEEMFEILTLSGLSQKVFDVYDEPTNLKDIIPHCYNSNDPILLFCNLNKSQLNHLTQERLDLKALIVIFLNTRALEMLKDLK